MSKKTFYAHSKPGCPPEEWQTLADHLHNVAEKAKSFASFMGAEEWAYAAGIMHDIGKFSEEFQERLVATADNENNIDCSSGRVDHSTAGAQEVCRNHLEIGKLLAYCLAGHHAGLPNGKDNTRACLDARLERIIPQHSPASQNISNQLPALSPPPLDLHACKASKEAVAFRLQMFIRMIFSSLVDADFLDTEKFLDPERTSHRETGGSLEEMRALLIKHIEVLSSNSALTLVNQKRREVFEDCLTSARKEPGFFSLTVPTGGGKTLSSLAFALEHAVRFGKERIIYTIPFTNIIEQNADVFRRVLGESAILEHHSNFTPEEDDYHSQLNAENWNAPLVVTTNVQFFESFYTSRTSLCRKLHNIANSVIILDEAQALPRDLLRPCLEILKELVVTYKCTVVLCTATQPALNRSNEFKNGLEGVREISRSPKDLYDELRRVFVEVLPKTVNTNIVSRLLQHEQVLCVVNTRKHARELYKALLGPDAYHLSALMCPMHRSRVLSEVKARLLNSKPCRLISTQLIEAGVDIDFPVVFRSLSGIDSVAQAAGRCNREGRLVKNGKVFVFTPEEELPVGFLRQSAETSESVIRKSRSDILSPEAVREYFLMMYWRAETLDKSGIIARLAEDVGRLNFPFADVGRMFNMIPQVMESVIIPYNDAARDIVLALRHAKFTSGLLRRAQKYTVNIYPKALLRLISKGAVEKVQDRFNVLINDHIYFDDIGLDDSDPDFRDIEKDIC